MLTSHSYTLCCGGAVLQDRAGSPEPAQVSCGAWRPHAALESRSTNDGGPFVAESFGAAGTALDTLAAAYAECGRFADAVLTASRALVAARSTRADEIRARIRLYERQLPFRQSGPGRPE